VEVTTEGLSRFFEVVLPHLNEVQRRVAAGAMAEMLGRGGKTRVAEASGMSRNTVIKAQGEVEAGIEPTLRLRAPGAGAKSVIETQSGLLEALDELVHPDTRGTPMSLLRWTSKSTANLARELVRQGFKVSDDTVGRILKRLGYSLQSPAKVKEGTSHPDRDGQFRYLDRLGSSFVADGEPVISVDTKKKELVGEFDNGGVEYQPAGEPVRVKVHDFVDPELGRAIPYGIYDETNNEGWVSVGDVADTAEFAVNSIRSWWNHMGRDRFPDATRLLITADAGGSNGHRVRAWKAQLARLAAGDLQEDLPLRLR
jgi:transposase